MSFDAAVLSFCLGGPLGVGVGTFFETDLWFGGSARGACNETDGTEIFLCVLVALRFLSQLVGTFARMGGDCFSV